MNTSIQIEKIGCQPLFYLMMLLLSRNKRFSKVTMCQDFFHKSVFKIDEEKKASYAKPSLYITKERINNVNSKAR